jgi:ligand-binding SRPBCC domain-containing protein
VPARGIHLPERTQTMMRDIVRYALPFGPLGTLTHGLVVRRTLDEIFSFRRRRIEEIFA